MGLVRCLLTVERIDGLAPIEGDGMPHSKVVRARTDRPSGPRAAVGLIFAGVLLLTGGCGQAGGPAASRASTAPSATTPTTATTAASPSSAGTRTGARGAMGIDTVR